MFLFGILRMLRSLSSQRSTHCLQVNLSVSLSLFQSVPLSVHQSICICLTEYDHMSASPLPCQWAEIDKPPGNLPPSWGLSTDSSGPPGPNLMSHTVDTFSTLTQSRRLFLFLHFTSIILCRRFSHREMDVCGCWQHIVVHMCMQCILPYILGAAEHMFIHLSGHV